MNSHGNSRYSRYIITCFLLNGISFSIQGNESSPKTTSASVLDVAEKLGATTFLDLVKKTNLTRNFTQKGPITVFIPSNQAFNELPEDERNNLKDPSYAKLILLYHIVHGYHKKASFQNEVTYKSESRIEGGDALLQVRLNIYHEGEVITASGSPMIKFDNEATNGIVHLLSRVMYLPPTFGSIAQLTSLPITRYVMYGLIDGGLAEKLNRKEPFTLFAPSDLAFESLPNKTMNILIGNKTAIRRVMENHILSGTYFTKGMRQNDRFTTMLGETLTVDSIKGNVTVSGSLLILPDFTATNGVVHIATKVFLPPDMY
ncbi:transforming growth factor-beta-induced protein ig-h3-like [Saccostrea echinata]|uniref:transforming growth factor-beta-induced protein ig-h3-like n=1 Tax=Saccostrea echinata TaxID=191078 RepID=UPI002A83ACD0|nr:transforming growth factor-beta-induced protein ig-h3-like [Saccostrea echinata]